MRIYAGYAVDMTSGLFQVWTDFAIPTIEPEGQVAHTNEIGGGI